MVQVLDTGIRKNQWIRRASGLYSLPKRNFSIDGLVLYLPLWYPEDSNTLRSGTGIATGSPIVLGVPAANTITVSQAGTFLINLPAGVTGTATSGTATITGSPVSLVAGLNTITAEGTGNFTVTIVKIISKDLNAHVCTVTGATWGVTGRSFDGDDAINAGTSAVLDFGIADPFTIDIWFKTSQASGNYKYLVGRSTGEAGWILMVHLGKLRLWLINTWLVDYLTADSPSNVNDGVWHNAQVGYDGTASATSVTMGIDGASVSPTIVDNLTAEFKQTAQPVRIGGQSQWGWYNGLIGSIGIHNRVLTLPESSYPTTKWRYI